MPDDDEVDARHLVGHRRHRIFRTDAREHGVHSGRRIESSVRHDHHHLGAGRSRILHRAAQRGHDIVDRELLLEVEFIPHHRPRRRDADDRDAHAAAIEERRRRPAAVAVDATYVGSEERKGRGGQRAVEVRQAVVELMVADYAGVVLERVHRGDDGIRSCKPGPRRDVRHGAALQKIAGVHEERAAGCCGAQ